MRLLDNKASKIDDGKNNIYQKDGKCINKCPKASSPLLIVHIICIIYLYYIYTPVNNP